MKILLICPKYEFVGYTPTGLASLAAVAEQLGHAVTIVDLNIERLPNKRDYDLVGITGLSLWKKSVLQVAEAFADKTVIVGGPWASLYPQDVLAHPSVDYVCIAEGEDTFKEFLRRYPDVANVRGIGDKGKVNPPRPFITNLDALPLPAWHLVKTQRYRRVSVVTSRGCPFNCIFCSVHTLLGRKWRARSVASIIEEIELLVNYHHVRHITLGDDNFTFQPDRAMQICEAIIRRGIKVELDAIQGVRADRLPLKLLDRMKEAGFTEIIIAPESGSQRVLDEIIGKGLDLSVVEPVVKHCRDIGLQCGAFFVIGFPWETMEEIQQTLALTEQLRGYGCSCFVGNALPFPDTRLYAQAKAEGFLRYDGKALENILYYLGKPRKTHCLTSPYWTPEEIIRICELEVKKNLRAFYRNYSWSQVVSKMVRHPLRSLKKVARML